MIIKVIASEIGIRKLIQFNVIKALESVGFRAFLLSLREVDNFNTVVVLRLAIHVKKRNR